MKLFWEAGFTDLWTELPGPGPAATWPQDRRIDYILGFGSTWTGTIRTVGAEPGPTGIIPSDHPGLIAVLTTWRCADLALMPSVAATLGS